MYRKEVFRDFNRGGGYFALVVGVEHSDFQTDNQ